MNRLKILFEDKVILVVDKPSGLVVNRSQTIREETLQDQIAAYFKLGKSLGIGDRAGIVHRLDREASGLLVIAKARRAFAELQGQFKARIVTKEYLALVHGYFKQEAGSITGEIGRIGKFGKFGAVPGKVAVTDYKVGSYYKFKPDCFDVLIHKNRITKARLNYLANHAVYYTLLSVFPKTGRTHQIRVHLKSVNHPLVSDLIYTPKKLLKFDLSWCRRLFLHAAKLSFLHPATGKKIEFELPLPNELKNAMLNLEVLDSKV